MDGVFITCMSEYGWEYIGGCLPMRSVAVGLLALVAVSGCATVSVMPGEALVEARVTQEQSNLRNVCNAYTEQAKAENWVTPTNGFLSIARVLIDGSSAKQAASQTYADGIEADTGDVEALYQRISTDISSARDGLEVVTAEAVKFVEASQTNKASLRRDVMSFESALVTAQKSRRNFAGAISIVAQRGDAGLSNSEAELAEFDIVIDRARDTVNRLALAHSANSTDSAVS